METIFNVQTRDTLIDRINLLTSADSKLWGKMNVSQMLKHCSMSEEMFLGKQSYNRLWIGKLFGKMALKGILKNEAPMQKNQPTHPDMKIKEQIAFEPERKKWIALLTQYSSYNNDTFVHPFFGKMTKDQIGIYVYKHTDHHLRQFGK